MTPGLAADAAAQIRETIPCQICGKSNRDAVYSKPDRFKFDLEPYAIVRCPDCDYLYVNPRPQPESLLRFYPDTYAFQEEASAAQESGLAFFFKKAEAFYRNQGLNHDVRRLLAVTKKKSGRIVEVGCGTGDRLHLLKQKGFEVLGLEPADAAREYGRRYFDLSIFADRLEDWAGPEPAADVICIFNVLEHLPYPIEQLKRLGGWLKKDGVLVIQIPNASSLQARWLGARWSSMDVPRDLFYFSPKAMRAAARLAGLRVERVEYGHHWMHPPTLISSLFPSIDPAVIWSEEKKAANPLKKVAWAAVTLLSIPLALLARFFKQSSLMTLYLRPESA